MKKCSCLFAPALNIGTKHEITLAVGRVFIGLTMAFAHGIGKLPPPQGLIDGVSGLGLPLPALFAWCAALSEFVGGILIALGLLTRPAALGWIITMAVAAFGAHAADPFKVKELALIYMAFSLVLLSVGPGRFSVDHILGQRCQK